MGVTPVINEDSSSAVVMVPACSGGGSGTTSITVAPSGQPPVTTALGVVANDGTENCGINAGGYAEPLFFNTGLAGSYAWQNVRFVLSAADDATIASPADGDVLRYSNGKWRNYPGNYLVDGGQF